MNGGAKGSSYQGMGCDGGDGGKGGDGGPGGSGAGGISAPIIYTGTAPAVTFSTLTPGAAGAAGPAVGGGNAGIPGTSVSQYKAN